MRSGGTWDCKRPAHHMLRSELPETLRVPPGDGVPYLGSKPRKIISDDIHGALVRCGSQADGPVRADHQTIRAKGFERNIEVWSDLLRTPPVPVCFGNEAREFAKYILEFGQPPDPTRPRLDFSHLDGRLR